MAKTFVEWTVLPHDPIEKLGSNLWRVSGRLGKIQRQMVLARMRDGRVVIHNAIALDEPEMKELEAWGKPSILFVPNAFHRQDAAIWKKRYPNLQVVTPTGARKKVAGVVPVDLTIEQAPSDDTVKLSPIAGCSAEGVLEVRTDGALTAVFNDVVLNMPKYKGLMALALAPTGQVSAPRFARIMWLKDKPGFARQLEGMVGDGLRRVLFGHGKPAEGDAAVAALRTVVAQMRG
jgi:hypothetical protein